MSFFDKLFRKKRPTGRLVEEEGFLDIDLPLSSVETGEAGETRFVAHGEVMGIDVGFAVVLQSTWNTQQLDVDDPQTNSPIMLYWGTGSYERTGPESDRFVELLAQRYGQAEGSSMLPSIDVKVVGINSDPSLAKEHGARMKFFFHSESHDEQRYAEVFTNINMEDGVLEFHEKDKDYRAPLIRALSSV